MFPRVYVSTTEVTWCRIKQKMIKRVDNWGFTDRCSPGQCRKPRKFLVKKTRPRFIQALQNTYVQNYGDANVVTSVPYHQMPLTLLSLHRITSFSTCHVPFYTPWLSEIIFYVIFVNRWTQVEWPHNTFSYVTNAIFSVYH